VQEGSWHDFSPRVGFDYQWTPDVMTYVSLAKGYKAGGINGQVPSPDSNQIYKPEYVRTYELGLRSDLFDHRVRLNATAFYNDYRDYQTAIGGVVTKTSGQTATFSITEGIPKARTVGGEVELTIVPARGLTLTGGLGITDAKFIELPTDAFWLAAEATGSAPVSTQTKFPYTPKTSFTLAAEYTKAVTDTVSATGRIDYGYKSAVQYAIPASPWQLQLPYGLLNARLTFEHSPSRLLLSVFGTNLTDKHYFTGGSDFLGSFGFATQYFAAPREWGATAQYRF
jgi:iron complex outermembrane receptor protein